MKFSLEEITKPFSSPKLVFYCLGWMMVILFLGTLDQKNIGLYQAQLKYFSSFTFLLYGVPVPGGYLAMTVLFVGLATKLAFHTRWNRNSLGVNITHFGGLLLLLGGFITAVFSREGNMALLEGQTSNAMVDYYNYEILIRDTTPVDHNLVTTFAHGWLKPGNVLKHERFPFPIEIVKVMENCEVQQRREGAPAPEGARGLFKNFDLIEAPSNKEAERNRMAVIFKVQKGDPAVDGVYAVFESMPIMQTFTVAGKKYEMELRKEETHLPFQIQLVKFKKETHPGTQIASAYSSRVKLLEGKITQDYTIQMNEPLRYKGYIFYQASFSEDPQLGETSVLAVVKNEGRNFPYISSLIMCFGLLLHLFLKIPQLIQRKTEV